MSPDISDYPDALDRIMSADVDPNSTRRGEVAKDLSDSGPQVTLEVATNVADSVLTEEQVLEALDGQGNLPTEQVIDSASRGLSDYSDADRRERVADSVAGEVVLQSDIEEAVGQARNRLPSNADLESDIDDATVGKQWVGQDREQAVSQAVESTVTLEDVADSIDRPRDSLPTESDLESDVRRAVADKDLPGVSERQVMRQVQDTVVTREDVMSEVEARSGPVFREDVEQAVETAEGELAGVSADRATDEVAREVGAPSRSQFERETTQAVAQADQVAPSDVMDDPTEREGIGRTGADQPVPVIRDQGGEVVAVTGAEETKAQAVAEATGAEYRSLSEVSDSFDLEQDRGRATLTIDGRPVREVDVE